MKWSVFALLLLPACATLAFDPAGPPPKKTLAWTAKHLTTKRFPTVEFTNATIEEAIESFQASNDRPKEYDISIDARQITPLAAKRISIQAKDIPVIEALALLAEQVDANLVITPGTIVFVPGKKS